MRGDTQDYLGVPGSNSGKKSSSSGDPADTTLFGVNILKVGRYINLIAGTVLTVICGMGIINIFKSANIL